MRERNSDVIFYVGTSFAECGYDRYDQSNQVNIDPEEINVEKEPEVDTEIKETDVENESDDNSGENDVFNEEEEGMPTVLEREMINDEEDSSIEMGMDIGNGYLMTFGVEDLANVALDIEDMEESGNLMNEDEENGFPCSNSGLAPIHQDWTDATMNNGIVHSYVLMNTMGNCLVRRNRNLHFSKKARAWSEKMITSGKGGKSIPLLYHEGSLHAHVFWMETDSGEIPGSLVSGLLTDGYNTK